MVEKNKSVKNTQNKSITESVFSVIDTNFAKGIAILFLLFHHLFYLSPKMGFMLSTGKTLEFYIATVMKVCVAMFLVLSGYGVYESTKGKAIKYFSFMKKNLIKILFNYWFIWLLFVPVGFLIIGGDFFTKVYKQDIIQNLLINLTGMQKMFMTPSILDTWWFVSLIITFYALFPVLRFLIDKSHITAGLTLAGSFLLMFFADDLYNTYFNTAFLALWLFPFTFGIFCAKYNLFVKFQGLFENKDIQSKAINLVLLSAIIGLLVYQRLFGTFKIFGTTFKDIYIDGILSFFIIALGYQFLSKIKYVKEFGIFMGKHSFNIFLFHSFIYHLYFKSFTYSLGSPIVIWLFLLITSIILSVAIEKLKVLVHFNEIQNKALGKK